LKQFLLEMHLHTSETSNCGRISAVDAVRMYKEKGYDGIVVTDHYSSGTFKRKIPRDLPYKKQLEIYLKGYRTALKAAGDDFTVLLGMELSLNETDNDYLVYGITEEFLLEAGYLLDMSIEDFVELAHNNGCLVYQAHPFRRHMTIVQPELLDGIEVYNGNPRSKSNNEFSFMWAAKYGLRGISGSDFHQLKDLACGGIAFPEPVRTNEELVKALKGRYNLIVPQDPTYND